LSCDTDTPWFDDQLSETGDTLKVAAPRRIAPITVSLFMMFLLYLCASARNGNDWAAGDNLTLI
jgi:hypothetical protein